MTVGSIDDSWNPEHSTKKYEGEIMGDPADPDFGEPIVSVESQVDSDWGITDVILPLAKPVHPGMGFMEIVDADGGNVTRCND